MKTDNTYKDIAEDVEKGLTLQILDYTDHCLKKEKKSNWINER